MDSILWFFESGAASEVVFTCLVATIIRIVWVYGFNRN